MSIMRITIRQRARAQRGVAIVELALILPVVTLLLVGILEFGIIMFEKNDVVQAARDGARQAAVNTSGANTGCPAASNWLGAACKTAPSASRICIRALDGNLNIGSRIRIRVHKDYNWFTPLAAALTAGSALALDGESVYRLEVQGSNLPLAATGPDPGYCVG
jgi:hypothetical protein